MVHIQTQNATGDSKSNPRRIVENEFKIINDPGQNRKYTVLNAISEDNHLPSMTIDASRKRVI